jgi:ligand-binding sensor domain-containing protein/serine phosphatase RsbU (regulator of sigma subunit)
MQRQVFLWCILNLLGTCLFAQFKPINTQIPRGEKVGLPPEKAISQYICEVWQKDKGLPQNSIFSITQSSDGYLWIATYEGIARFDGMIFTTFSTSNVAELKTSGIWKVYEDSKKNLWFGTNNGGLTRYSHGKFKTFTTDEGLPSNTITAIIEDHEKSLWIGTRQGLVQRKDGKFKTFTTQDGLSNREITSLYLGADQTLWIGTARGLTAYKNGKFEDIGRTKIIFINKSITSVCEDHVGNLWIATQGGLVRWNYQNKTYKTFRVDDGLSDDYINKVFCDTWGTLWIGTQSGGLMRVIKGYLNELRPRFDRFTVKEGLKANSINEIYEDHEGNLWLGLNRGGLNCLKDGKFTNFTTLEGLTDNVTNCIYEDHAGGVWVGTVSGGVSYFKNGKFNNFTTETGLSNNYVRSVLQDRMGNIWLATYGGGLNQLIFDGKSNLPTIKVYTIKDSLASNITRVLLESRDGSLWIGTKNGLSRFKNGKFKNYTRQSGLSDNSITCLMEDSKGNIWVGTDGGGLNCLQVNGSIAVFDNQDGLGNNLIFSLLEDKNGAIWVGTKGGLTRIKGEKIQNIFAKDGLAHDAVHSLIEDNWGRMWMSCNSGVFWAKKTDLDSFVDGRLNKVISVLYQEDDGMKSSDCAASAQPTALKDRLGNLWYPTTEGIAMLNPTQIKINLQKPPLVIKRVVADNLEYNIYEKLVFKPGTSKFEIDFASLSFVAPHKIVYRYRLSGDSYTEDWVTTMNREDAFYTNLPPGKYTFEVQGSNNDGIWNKEGTKIEFYLEPFFYQTYWFYILIFLLVLSLGFAIYYLRIRALERRQRALQQGIDESTQKIRQQYHEINLQAEELKTINNIVRTINQEVKFENVLQSLLDQGLLLFPQSDKGIFLVYSPEEEVFRLVASHGYEDMALIKAEFSYQEVINYCETGLTLADELFKLQPAINLRRLSPTYKPKSSLAMQIRMNGHIDGVIFFDNAHGFQDVQFADIQKLTRFKEHAVSAFTKAKILQEIESKNQQIENSFKKISDSIRYARRIQRAILTEESKIAPYFEEFFIFYEPKDIVSGDFYWFAETPPEPIYAFEMVDDRRTSVFKGFGDPKYILAAVDCTGHGVPGAFMTVIGNDLLNTIVMEDKINKADKILTKLDRNVRNYLKQETEGSQSRDGMDMALIIINDLDRNIEFAGAKNPLYFIRNGELTEISASKFPIGGAQVVSAKKVFHSHKFDYQTGDIMYLFSDGFHDQFGGEQDRKFGSKRFREFLLGISHLPMSEQKQIVAQVFSEWKGNKAQTDDVLVIGVKMS